MRVLRTPAGVEEDIALTLGYGPDETPPLHALEAPAAELDDGHGLVTLLTALRSARRDLTVPARAEPLPVPVALTLGHDEVRRVGRSRAEHQHPGATPVRLGAALHYRLEQGAEATSAAGATEEIRKP